MKIKMLDEEDDERNHISISRLYKRHRPLLPNKDECEENENMNSHHSQGRNARSQQGSGRMLLYAFFFFPLILRSHKLFSAISLTTQTMEVPGNTCKSLNLANYTQYKAPIVHNWIAKQKREAKCFEFKCNTNITTCDNVKPTNYTGPDPPCCTHILRDMARIFDKEMCRIGLDYLAGFGTLLGFVRSGRVIPWTADLDFILPSEEVANAMVSHWDTKRTGMAHLFQGINRICITEDFGGGGLTKWKKKPAMVRDKKTGKMVFNTQLWSSGVPYIDFYIAKMVNNFSSKAAKQRPDLIKERWKDGGIVEILAPGCQNFYRDLFPSKRVLVYEDSNGKNGFSQNLPANTTQLLRSWYGADWNIPSSKRSPHGEVEPCSYSPVY